MTKRDVLNKYEFFKANHVIKEEVKKGNNPAVVYYRDHEKDPYTIYIVRIRMHVNGGDFHDYVAHAKRESLVKKKVKRIEEILTFNKESSTKTA
jgi:hypothetical protein